VGWDPKPNEAPDVEQLRHTVLADLGTWRDASTIAEAKKRFARFVTDRGSVPPDEQSTLLSIVAINADGPTSVSCTRLRSRRRTRPKYSGITPRS